MKPKNSLRSFLALSGSALLAISSAAAATLYWDGTTASANADGGAGTWDNGTTDNWDTLPFAGADSVWTNGAHTAVFGGATATVPIGTGGVTVGGLTFNANNYVINAGTEGLTFSSGTNIIQAYIGNNGDTTASITGLVSGTGSNIVLSSGADQRLSTLNLNGTSAGGWDGTTTIHAGSRMSLAASNQALLNTTGITLNGGNILSTNTATGSENTIDRISDSAAISSYGSGSILIANTATASRAYTETIGSVTHNNGQLSLGFTINQNQASNTQTLRLAGLTRSGTTSTIAISSGGSGASSIGVNSLIWVNGVATSTPAGEIIAPWLTAGTIPGALSDWAVYSSDGTDGRFLSAAIAASDQSTWSTTHAATSNYSLDVNRVVNPERGRLTEDRNINTLRMTTGDLAPSVVDPATDYITMATNTFLENDALTTRNTLGGVLTQGRVYYVINKDGAGAGTFQVSTTPGGAAVDLTTAATGFVNAAVNLNGNTIGTYGIITGSTAVHGIGSGVGGSNLTLPTTTSDNLYVYNGGASLWIDSPITDNGAGILTLVKGGIATGGSGDVTLASANTYTGGTVINSGTLTFLTNASWVSGQNITFGGAGRINASVGALTGGTLDIDQGAVGYITGTSAITFATTTGAGKISYAGGNSATLALGNAGAFTGDLQVAVGLGSNPYPSITFSSIGDTAGSAIQYGAGSGDSNQRGIIAFDGSSALTLSNRQIQILPRSIGNNSPRRDVLVNNSTSAAHNLVIGQNLLNTVDRANVEFQLDGTNTGNNEFAGDIGDSTYSAVASPARFALNVYKNGAGKWILSGDNTFTGKLHVSNGTLSVGTFNDSSTAGALGMGSIIQLGGSEVGTPTPNPTGGSGLAAAAVLSSSNSGTLEYTGGAASTSRTFQIGSTTTHTGGGTIANNGGGALTFTAANLNDAIAGVSVARTLTLAGSNTGNNEIQGTIRDNVASTGKINLAKSGAGTWALTGTNTYTGTTSVSAGTLTLGVTDCLADTSNVAIGAGALSVGAGFTDTVGTLDCTGAATINLGNSSSKLAILNSNGVGGNWGANTLTITGTFAPGNGTDPGNPGSLRFGTDNTGLSATQLSKISATGWTSFGLDAFGYLTATPVGGGSAYDTWKAANAPGSNPDDDTDGDGVTNAVEFVLGGTSATNDLGKLPAVAASGADMTFTFFRKQSSIDPKTSLMIEVGTDLVTWTTPPSPYTVPDGVTAGPPVSVVKGVPADYDTITLTVPKAPDSKKFARLKVVITP